MPELAFPRRIVLGEKAPRALRLLLESLGARRVLLVTDPVVARQPWARELVEELRRAGVELDVYDRVPPEPPEGVAEEIAPLARGRDAVIALGGGSVIDAAKAGVVLAKRPGTRIEDIAPFNPLGIDLEKPVLIAVPTTAGTGSDASLGIVLSREEPGGKVKIAVGSPEVVPYASILDPRLPASAPPRVRVGAVVDALSHALESLASTAANPFSTALAEHAARIIFTTAPRAVRGGSQEDWEMLHAAATMAGIAFTNSGLGLAHAVAHPLGGALGTHHGLTVGIVMRWVLRLYEQGPTAGRLERLKLALEAVEGLPREESLHAHLERLYREIGAPARFRELGVEEERFLEAARLASERYLNDPDLAFSPVYPGPEEVLEALKSLY